MINIPEIHTETEADNMIQLLEYRADERMTPSENEFINETINWYEKIIGLSKASLTDSVYKTLWEQVASLSHDLYHNSSPSLIVKSANSARTFFTKHVDTIQRALFLSNVSVSNSNIIASAIDSVTSEATSKTKKIFQQLQTDLATEIQTLEDTYKAKTNASLDDFFKKRACSHRVSLIIYTVLIMGIVVFLFCSIKTNQVSDLLISSQFIPNLNNESTLRPLLYSWLIYRLPLLGLGLLLLNYLGKLFRSHYRLLLDAKFKREISNASGTLLKSVSEEHRDHIWMQCLNVLLQKQDDGLIKTTENEDQNLRIMLNAILADHLRK